jgi:hypothetical protein
LPAIGDDPGTHSIETRSVRGCGGARRIARP